MSELTILECTLRDASYTIGFQFTADETTLIAAALEDAGFRWIEVGHGLGLNASCVGEGEAAETDEEYILAAKRGARNSKIGVFYIPGIGRLEDLERASNLGIDFVRIGTNAPEAERSQDAIKLAKDYGLNISSNMMKSYALPPEKLLAKAKIVEGWGTDVVTLVDSAGGMLPRQITEYMELLSNNLSISLGFHGHNNLSMAVANSLTAIDSGATFIDSTLQGLGRSGGNAATEILLTVLRQEGHELGIDEKKVFDIGQRFIRPLVKKVGVDKIDIVVGASLFHSKFLDVIYEAAARYDLDPADLIVETSKHDLVEVSPSLAEKVASDLAQRRHQERSKGIAKAPQLLRSTDPEVSWTLEEEVQHILKRIHILSHKKEKGTMFTMAESRRGVQRTIFPYIRETPNAIIGNAEVANKEEASSILSQIDGNVDIVIVDATSKDLPSLSSKILKQSQIKMYNEEHAWASAIVTFACHRNYSHLEPLILGVNPISMNVIRQFSRRGVECKIWDPLKDKRTCLQNEITGCMYLDDVSVVENIPLGEFLLIGLSFGQHVISPQFVEKLSDTSVILDASLNSLEEESIGLAQKKGISVIRLDMRGSLMGELEGIMESDYVISNAMGTKDMEEITLVAGGLIGKLGDIVVDSIMEPTQVLGVADGKGGLLMNTSSYQKNADRIKEYLLLNRLEK